MLEASYELAQFSEEYPSQRTNISKRKSSRGDLQVNFNTSKAKLHLQTQSSVWQNTEGFLNKTLN